MKKKLTQATVMAALEAGATAELRDVSVSGLRLRVTGVRRGTWFYDYTMSGKRRRMSIGRANAVTLVDARTAARQLAGQIAAGRDPLSERAEARAYEAATRPLSEVADEWRESWLAGGHREDSVKNMRRDIAAIKRHLGSVRIDALCEADFQDLMRKLRDTPSMANAIVKRFRSIAKWCRARGYLKSDPSEFITLYPSGSRARRASPDELARLERVLRGVEERRYLEIPGRARPALVPPMAAAVVRVMLYTGLRIGEVLKLRPEMLDRGRSMIVLRRTKTSHRGGSRPLTRRAQQVLAARELESGTELLFPAQSGEELSVSGMWDLWRKIRLAADIPDLALHDLRRTFCSVATDLKLPDATIAACVGHKLGSVTGRYTRPIEETVIRSANEIADEIARQMEAEDTGGADAATA